MIVKTEQWIEQRVAAGLAQRREDSRYGNREVGGRVVFT